MSNPFTEIREAVQALLLTELGDSVNWVDIYDGEDWDDGKFETIRRRVGLKGAGIYVRLSRVEPDEPAPPSCDASYVYLHLLACAGVVANRSSAAEAAEELVWAAYEVIRDAGSEPSYMHGRWERPRVAIEHQSPNCTIVSMIMDAHCHLAALDDSVVTPDDELPTLGKDTPVDGDRLTLWDSAASWARKYLSWSSLKATLKTYFDTLYAAASALSDHTGNTSNPHEVTAALAGADATGTASGLLTTHTTTHPAPTTRDSRNEAAGTASGLLTTHTTTHPAPTDRDARNDAAGAAAAVASDLSDHKGAADPHAGYLLADGSRRLSKAQSVGATLYLENSTDPGVQNQWAGIQRFYGKNDAGEDTIYAYLYPRMTSVEDGNESCTLTIGLRADGELILAMGFSKDSVGFARPLTLVDPDSDYEALRVEPTDTAPTSPGNDAVYLDDGTNTTHGRIGWRYWTGSAWQDIGGAQRQYLRGTITDPNGLYALDHEVCVWLRTDAAITIRSVRLTCDAGPASELDVDLMFADAFIGQANASLVVACDTAGGASEITEGFDDATVPAGKALYFRFNAEPHADITQVAFEITYTVD